MNADASFATFYLGFTTLFRAATGENWNGMMHDCYYQVGPIGIIYWLLFELVVHFVFMDIFLAVIYENFIDVKASENESDILSLRRKDIKAFINTWSVFCPNGEAYMKT